MRFQGLHSVADYAALYAALRQQELDALLERQLGDYAFEYDLGAGSLTFTSIGDDSSHIDTAVVLIATIAADCGSLQWAWAHPGADPTSAACRLRDLGVQHGIADLRSSTLGLPTPRSEDEAQAYSADLAQVLGGAGVEATGISPYYSAPLDDGGRAVMVLTDLTLPEPTFADFAVKAPRLLPGLQVTNPRPAVQGLAMRRGWSVGWDAHGRGLPTCHVSDGTSSVTIGFDDRGRAVEFETSLQPTSEVRG